MNHKFIIVSIFFISSLEYGLKQYFLDKDKHVKQDIADKLETFFSNDLYVNDKEKIKKVSCIYAFSNKYVC